MKQFLLGAAVLAAAYAPAAMAQSAAQNVAQPPLRAVITAVDASALQLTDTAGAKITMGLLPGAAVIDVVPGNLADMKPGSYIGSAAMKQPDGTYRAIELQIFPPAMKGVGLGTRAWNLQPKSTMTNGTVRGLTSAGGTVGAVKADGDTTLDVNDGSGEKTILIPQGVPVVTFMPGKMADLVPGAHVLIFASRTPDGKLVTGRVNVGLNGLVPPM